MILIAILTVTVASISTVKNEKERELFSVPLCKTKMAAAVRILLNIHKVKQSVNMKTHMGKKFPKHYKPVRN